LSFDTVSAAGGIRDMLELSVVDASEVSPKLPLEELTSYCFGLLSD